MELNENGYLVKTCKVARVGELEYLGSEIGIDDSPNKIFKVYRDADELFNPETLKSFEGVPVTLLHPDSLEVKSDNWMETAKGHAQNFRPDDNKEFLLCEIYLQDASTIEIVDKHDIKELSAGYDSILEYQDGRIKQTRIRGNHTAIVPEGRCGSECKIGDRGISMKPEIKIKIADSLNKHLLKLKALQINDAEPEKTAEEAQSQLQEAATAVQEAITAVEEVKKEVAATPDTVVDAPEDGSEDADKDARIAELEARIAELEAELKAKDEEAERASTMNDAALRFPKLKINDAKSARDVRERVLLDSKAFSQSDMKKMNDAEIKAAYAAVCAINPAKNNIGSKLLADSKPKATVSASKRLGGK